MNKKSQLYWLPKIKQNFFKTMLGAKRWLALKVQMPQNLDTNFLLLRRCWCYKCPKIQIHWYESNNWSLTCIRTSNNKKQYKEYPSIKSRKYRVTDVGKWLENLSLVIELPIKTIYECLILFNLHLIAFINSLYECLIFFNLYLIAFISDL